MNYILHGAAGSCSLAPHIVLEEVGARYALKLLSTDRGDTRTDEFRRLNPKGRFPVLEAENFQLTEAPAILIHLAMAYPEAGLLEQGGDSLVRVVEWFNWLSGTVHSVAVRMIWRTDYFTSDPRQHDEIAAKGREHLSAAFSIIEERLGQRPWAVGNRYSIVDPFLLVFYRWGNRMRIDMRGQYPAWTVHAEQMEARHAVQRALQQEGVSLWR